MARWLGWSATAVALIEFGWILGSAAAGVASAQDVPAVPSPRDVQCRAFMGAPDRPGTVDTSDRTTEIGQWVGDAGAKGWRVASVDFEVATKPTGYPQPWIEVCLER